MPEPSTTPPVLLPLASGPASLVDEGAGPAVVLVHGLPGSVRDFRWLAPHLVEAGLRVIRVDLPGFGGTPVQTLPDPSPEGRAAFVAQVIDALGLQRPLVVGHSMGGVVATAVAALRPLGGLGLVSSPGLRVHRGMRQFPARPLAVLTGGPRRQTWMMPLIRRLFERGGFKRYPDEALLRTIRCVAATDLGLHAERVRALGVPTLVAWCEDDPLIEADIFAELAASCPAGPRLRWAEGGHNPQKTFAAEIAGAVWGMVAGGA